MEIAPLFTVLVPIVLGITEVVKRVGVSNRFAPLVSLLLGVLGGILVGGIGVTSILQGVAVGLSASGLWSGVKASFFG